MTWVIVAGTAIGASIGAGTAAARGQRGWGIGKSALMGGAGGAVTGGLGGLIGGTAGGVAGGTTGGTAGGAGFGAAPALVEGPLMAGGGFFSQPLGALQAGTMSGSELLNFAGPPALQQTLGGLSQPGPQRPPLAVPAGPAPPAPPMGLGWENRRPTPQNYYEGTGAQDMAYRSIPTNQQGNLEDYIKLLQMLSRR